MRNLMSGIRGVAAPAVAAALGLALFAALPAEAQGTPPAQPTPQQQPAAGQAQPPAAAQNPAPPAQPPVTKEEEDAYKAFYDLTAQQRDQVISTGEDFLSKHPTSIYRSVVYARLVLVYLNSGKLDKMFSTGEKALAENPDNIDVLALMCTTLPVAGFDPRGLDANQKLDQAEKYAKHAIQLASTLAKPASMTDEEFTKSMHVKLGMAHSGLGRVYYWEGKTADSVNELGLSVKTDPSPDLLDYYLLGTGELRLKDYSDAGAAFESCSKSAWAWQDRCKKSAEDAEKMAAAPPAVKP